MLIVHLHNPRRRIAVQIGADSVDGALTDKTNPRSKPSLFLPGRDRLITAPQALHSTTYYVHTADRIILWPPVQPATSLAEATPPPAVHPPSTVL